MYSMDNPVINVTMRSIAITASRTYYCYATMVDIRYSNERHTPKTCYAPIAWTGLTEDAESEM